MLDLFRIALGLEIDGGASLLSGTGAPGNDSAEQDAASIGSIYMRTDTSAGVSQTYVKKTDTNATSDWVQNASKDYVDSLVSGLSWREPARILDSTNASIVAATSDADADDQIDGVTIQAGDRILFTGFTTDNNNVYIVSGSTGSWTLTEDANTAADGDAILITEGSSSEQQWVFDGTDWVHFGGVASNLELGYIRTFIGKTGVGSETPTYSSTNIVTTGNNLETAIGDLDAEIGTINTAIGNRTYTEQNYVTNSETITTSIDELDQALQNAFDAIGNRTYTEQNYVTNSETITASIDALDQALADVNGLSPATGTTVTTITTIDEVTVDSTDAAKWFLVAIDEATSTQKYAAEIYSVHNGTSAADATEVDYNKVSILRTGAAAINGLAVTVDINGTGATQTMRLRVASTDAVTVKALRVSLT